MPGQTLVLTCYLYQFTTVMSILEHLDLTHGVNLVLLVSFEWQMTQIMAKTLPGSLQFIQLPISNSLKDVEIK